MASPVFHETVTGDHSKGILNGGACHVLCTTVDDHSPTLRPVPAETVASEAFTRFRPLMDRKTIIFPGLPVVEERRFDHRHAGLIGVGLGSHILTITTGPLNRPEKLLSRTTPAGIGMDDVQRSARSRCALDRLFQTLRAPSHMDVRRRAMIGRNPQHRFKLDRCRRGRVCETETDRNRPLPQTFGQYK